MKTHLPEILKSVTASDLQLELARRKLSKFVQLMWPVVEPGTPLVWSWYLDAICDHLQAITDGHIRNLIINIPPRHLKSTLVSVMWPCFEWIHKPAMRYLTSSYAKELAVRDAVRSRRVIGSPLYQKIIDGAFSFTGDQNLKSRYENTETGWRICTSVGSTVTGEGGNRVICDDPHNVTQMESDVVRLNAIRWWDCTMSTRLNNPKLDAKVLVMQRIRENDLTGHLLEQGGYEHLCMPTEYEIEHPHKSVTSLGFKDPRSEEGEVLSPEHFGQDEIASAKRSLGSLGYTGQYQQRPAPTEGAFFKEEWFKVWTRMPARFDRVIASWDLSFTGKDSNVPKARQAVASLLDPSYVVGQVWGFVGPDAFLLDEARGQWGVTATMKQIITMKQRWPDIGKILIEEKANGSAVLELLDGKIPGLYPINPGSDGKDQRAWAALPYVEAGNVLIPEIAMCPWINDWKAEICTYPFGKHNDRVDAMVQVLIHELGGGANKALELLQNLTTW